MQQFEIAATPQTTFREILRQIGAEELKIVQDAIGDYDLLDESIRGRVEVKRLLIGDVVKEVRFEGHLIASFYRPIVVGSNVVVSYVAESLAKTG